MTWCKQLYVCHNIITNIRYACMTNYIQSSSACEKKVGVGIVGWGWRLRCEASFLHKHTLTLLHLSFACLTRYSALSLGYFDSTYPKKKMWQEYNVFTNTVLFVGLGTQCLPIAVSICCSGREGRFPLPLTLHLDISSSVNNTPISCP